MTHRGRQPAAAAWSRPTPTDYWNDSCADRRARVRGRARRDGRDLEPGHRRRGHEEGARVTGRPASASSPLRTRPGPRSTSPGRSIEEMGVRGAGDPRPGLRARGRAQGPPVAPDEPGELPRPGRGCSSRAMHFAALAPNIQVKFPTTAAGLAAIEEATARGVAINATVGFTVPQAIAVGEAVERGLRRFEAAGGDASRFSPVCTIMVGRLDDWVKVLVERDGIAARSRRRATGPGIAVFKRAYGIYQERGYRTRLLAAAYRHRLHWTELVGGDVVLTMPHAWQVRFNASGIAPSPGSTSRSSRRTSTTCSRRDPGLRARLRARRPRDRRVRRLTARPCGPCARSSRRTTTSRA